MYTTVKTIFFGILIATIIEFFLIPSISALLIMLLNYIPEKPLGVYLLWGHFPVVVTGIYIGYRSASPLNKNAFLVGFLYFAMRSIIMKGMADRIIDIFSTYYFVMAISAGVICLFTAFIIHCFKNRGD